MNSFEGHPVIITEERFKELTEKEKKLDTLMATYTELKSGHKLTPAAKKYKLALEEFVERVDKVLSSEDMIGMFQIAYVHGFKYKGESLAPDIIKVRKLLNPNYISPL